jgi:hypothetical protein
MRKKIGIIVHVGAPMDLIVPRSAGFSGCVAWRKARPDLAEQVHYVQEKESRPPRKEWRPKSTKADTKVSADAHMVFVLLAEFHARTQEEPLVAQLDLGPRPVIFENPQAKNYKHLKALYLKGYINSQPVNKMLVDT